MLGRTKARAECFLLGGRGERGTLFVRQVEVRERNAFLSGERGHHAQLVAPLDVELYKRGSPSWSKKLSHRFSSVIQQREPLRVRRTVHNERQVSLSIIFLRGSR